MRHKDPSAADFLRARARLDKDSVVLVSGCREWLGARLVTRDGLAYGRFQVLGETMVHRVAYRLAHGEIPQGLQVDHLCSNTLCIESAHLEAVSQQENIRRTWRRGRGQNRTKMAALEYGEWLTRC